MTSYWDRDIYILPTSRAPRLPKQVSLIAELRLLRAIRLNCEREGAASRDMAAAFDVYYDGSRIFSWVSDLSGLPLDQVSCRCKKCEFVLFSSCKLTS